MPRGTHPLVHLFTLDESFSSEQQDRLVELLKIAGLAACVDFPPVYRTKTFPVRTEAGFEG